MGYYIQTDGTRNKAEFIVEHMGGEMLKSPPRSYTDIPEGKALIVVVANPMFEAAAFIYKEREFEEFVHDPNDPRPKKFVLMDRDKAEVLSGYRRSNAVSS